MSNNNELTEIVFILDKSGSMDNVRDDAIGGFNAFLNEQKKVKGKANLTLILFDHHLETVVNGVDINQVEELTDATYVPSGMTALNDAIGFGIDNLKRRLKKYNEETNNVIFVIMTDGYENMSQEYDIKSIKKEVEKLQKNNGYEFVFLGANIDAIEEGSRLGIAQSVNFNADSSGVQDAYTWATQSVSNYRQADRSSNSNDESDE